MIPTAPTDNLYKFLTFLGIVLFVFCAWTLSDQFLQVDREISKAESANRMVERRLESIEARMNTLSASKTAINERLSRRNEVPLTSEEVTQLLARVEQITEQMTQTGTESAELARENDRVLPIAAEARVLLRYYDANSWVLYFGAGFGLVMSIIGILMWYFLHQRFQDALLRNQLTSVAARNDLPAKTDGPHEKT